MPNFGAMHKIQVPGILVEKQLIESIILEREVAVDFYLPTHVENPARMNLLLLNDGQNMEEMGFEAILESLYANAAIEPIFCAAIHAGVERKREYGVASDPDYNNRGDKAPLYTRFILEELLPFIRQTYVVPAFQRTAFAGFSLGGLSALDIVWNHPNQFNIAGVFSGSLWWRSVAQEDEEYDDDKHRIMHELIKSSPYKPGLKFFFQCGNMDETKDRNNNGIIDSIDDTLDLVAILEQKGYERLEDIMYNEMSDGRHDVATWGRALPVFLIWSFGNTDQ